LKTSQATFALSAQVRVVVDDIGQGKNRRAIRRALLIDRDSGLLHELPTTFVFREHGQKALHTQRDVLYDLAFYLEWTKLKAARSVAWVNPEIRLRAGRPALSEREIVDLSARCQSTAKDLVGARRREGENLRMLAPAKSVDSSTTNRRLENICRYLVWLTKDTVEGTAHFNNREIALSVYFQESLNSTFSSHMSAQKKAAPFGSLTKAEAEALRKILASSTFFPSTPSGRRDRLISRLLFDSGLRAGELLKLQCGDINDNYDFGDGRTVAIIKVIRRPNDPADERICEPAVKTLPGPIIINRRLASDIVAYIIGDRRAAVERGSSLRDTPYLFVCHSGPRKGKPISQRNLNRIVSKLKSVREVPHALSPHTLRHTHFTELVDICSRAGKNSKETQEVVRTRGHWAPNSETPKRYTSRFTAKLEADLVEERDRQLALNN
jgi:integrase